MLKSSFFHEVRRLSGGDHHLVTYQAEVAVPSTFCAVATKSTQVFLEGVGPVEMQVCQTLAPKPGEKGELYVRFYGTIAVSVTDEANGKPKSKRLRKAV